MTFSSDQAANDPDPRSGHRRRTDVRVWLYALPVVPVSTFVFVGPLVYSARSGGSRQRHARSHATQDNDLPVAPRGTA